MEGRPQTICLTKRQAMETTPFSRKGEVAPGTAQTQANRSVLLQLKVATPKETRPAFSEFCRSRVPKPPHPCTDTQNTTFFRDVSLQEAANFA